MFLAEGSNAGSRSAIRSTANYQKSCSPLLSKRQSWTQPSLRFKPAQKPASTATEKSSSAPLMPSTQSGQDKRSRTRPVLEVVRFRWGYFLKIPQVPNVNRNFYVN